MKKKVKTMNKENVIKTIIAIVSLVVGYGIGKFM